MDGTPCGKPYAGLRPMSRRVGDPWLADRVDVRKIGQIRRIPEGIMRRRPEACVAL